MPSSASRLRTPNASDLHEASQPILECFHLAMEGENVPATIYPCREHPGMKRRTVFGMKLSSGHIHKGRCSLLLLQVLLKLCRAGNDPFNYEHKYPEDDPYKELADNSRFWKICVDEAAKIDAGKVADWTDALDVLLVFVSVHTTKSYVPLILHFRRGYFPQSSLHLCARLSRPCRSTQTSSST